MANPEAVGICLHQLMAREAAVIKRVIAFSGSQGRNYYATDLLTAQIVIVSDDQPVDFSQMNPQGSMIVRIAGQGSTEPYDVLMMRPLLVTRVMRTLDEAHALLGVSLGNDPVTDVSEPGPASSDAEVVTGAGMESASESISAPAAETEAKAEEVAPASAEADDTSPVAETAEMVSAAEAEVPQQENTKAEAVPEEAVSPDSHDGHNDHAEVIDADAEAERPAQPAPPAGSEEAKSVVSQAVKAVESEAQKQAQIAASDEADDDQYRALVVDDSAAIRKQLELELRDAGISADFAEDGEQAMEKVANNHYDLIFLDIIMPGIDGYEACRQMRMRAELKKTPIIMLSAKTSPLDEVQGVIAGASTYLTKPVKSEQLQSTLKRVSMWIDNFQVA